MSNINDFIIENGMLTKYIGEGGDVVIPDSVTSIGEEAFRDCKNLVSITIPDSVTSIGEKAFCNCGNLETINIPDNIEKICNGTFLNCNIKAIVIPDSIKSIGERAFDGCDKLTSVTIPSKVTTIGDEAFKKCENLTSITFIGNVNEIGENVFEDCVKLASIVIPNGICSLKHELFKNCQNLEIVHIPGSIKYLYKGFYNSAELFCKCESLKEIVFPNDIEVFDGSVLELFWNYFLENKLSYLEDKINNDLKAVALYSFLKHASKAVLSDEKRAKKVKTFRKRIIEIIIKNDDAQTMGLLFSLCKPSGIAEVNEYIGKTMDAMNLKAYLLDYKNTKYSSKQQEQHENDKFEKALGLKPLTVAELKKIYRYNVENGAVVITGYKGNDNDVIIPETIGKSTVTCINTYAFIDNKKIVSVTLPNTLKSIRNYAFYRCVNLQSIRIPDSVKFIMEKSFAGCTNLTIYAPAGSKAEKYAKKYNINFVAE